MEEKELRSFLIETKNEIASAVNKRDEEIKAYGKATEETGKKLEEITKRFDEIKGELAKADQRIIEMEKEAKRNMTTGGYERKSLGDAFTASEVYKEIQDTQSATNKRFEVRKDLVFSGATSAGPMIFPDYKPGVFQNPDRKVFVRDLLPSIPTSSNSVKVVRELVFTNGAAPQVSPAVDLAGKYQLASKAESGLTWETVTIPIETMAHWIPVERQALSDAPMMASLINGRLAYGLRIKGDAQLLYGTGLNNELTGLMVDDAVSDIGYISASIDADDLPGAMIDHIRKAITKCQTYEYYNINGVVINPEDWETIELAKGSDGHYIWVNVNNGGIQQLWRVPVIITNSMLKSSFVLGDWNMGAHVYDREGINIRVADQHGELFVKNGVVVLAEERYGLGIELPLAFAKGSFEQSS